MFEKSKNFINTKILPKKPDKSKLTQETTTEKSKKDAASAVQLCRRFLTILGIWQLDDTGNFSWRFVVSNFLLVICYYGLGIRTIPTIIYIFTDEKDLKQLCNLLARAVFTLMSSSKYIFLRFHRRDIVKCVKDIEIDWLAGDSSAYRDIMLQHSQYGSLVTKIYAAVTYTAAIWQASLPFVLKKMAASVANDNATQTVTVRSFPVPSYFGSDLARQTPFFEIISTSQITATFMMHGVGIACYSIAVVSVMHACGQFKILIMKINNLIDGDDTNRSIDKKLSSIIKSHVKTLRFSSSAERMLREIYLIDLGGSTIEICFLGYLNILEFRAERKNYVAIFVYITYVISFTFNLFSICYISELLNEQCMEVGKITYMIDWHRLPGKQPLALGLIITMAHSPLSLTAGGAIQLSFKCFAAVLRTSVGYLNMLRAVMD